MSNVYDVGVKKTSPKQNSLKKRLSVGAGALGASALVTVPAQAAIDFSGITQQFTELKTGIEGVIALAIAVAIVIVGWRWVKRGIFSI